MSEYSMDLGGVIVATTLAFKPDDSAPAVSRWTTTSLANTSTS